jgi:hypothetical protein
MSERDKNPSFSPVCTLYLSFRATGGVCHSPRPPHPSKRVTEDERIRYACRFYYFFLSTNNKCQNTTRGSPSFVPSTSRSKRREVFATHHATASLKTSDGGRAYKVRSSIFVLSLSTNIPISECNKEGLFPPSHFFFLPNTTPPPLVSSNRRCSSQSPPPPPVSSYGRFASPLPPSHPMKRAPVGLINLSASC